MYFRCCAGEYRHLSVDGEPDALTRNSEYAEQQNSLLAMLKPLAAHMRPDTLLWLIPVALYFQAKRASQHWLQR